MFRRRRSGIFPFIFMIFIFGSLIDVFEVFGFLFPLAIVGFIAAMISRSLSGENTSTSSTTRRRTTSTYRRTERTTTVTNTNQVKIDKALASYFAENDRLMITDNIYLANPNNKFVTADKMYVCYYGEQVCTLKEFGARYPDVHQEIMILLNKFAKKGYSSSTVTEVKKPEVKKETAPKVNKKPKSRADEYIDQINELNIKIENVDITNGLNQTCDLLKRIELVDKEDGKEDEKLNKLYEYYLPILTGILEDYKRLSTSAIKGDEFKKCETQLIKTLNLINQALMTIAESMHDSDYMNLNADINTLQSLLKKDGFTQNPFKENKND